MSKKAEINYGIASIKGILQQINPQKADDWSIMWDRVTDESVKNFTEWQVKYFDIRVGDEMFFIWERSTEALLYVVNVTYESTLYSLMHLMQKLADKF